MLNNCGRMPIQFLRDMSFEDIEELVINLFKFSVAHKTIIYGYIYVPEKGLYIVAPVEELDKMQANMSKVETGFDFENYINTTEDDIFWVADYLNEHGPTVLRMQR